MLPDGVTVCDSAVHSLPYSEVFEGMEVDMIRIDRHQRRLDLRWSPIGDVPRWQAIPREIAMRSQREVPALLIGRQGVLVEGQTNEMAVQSFGMMYLLPETNVARYLIRLVQTAQQTDLEGDCAAAATVANMLVSRFRSGQMQITSAEEWREMFYGSREQFRPLFSGFDFGELAEIVNSSVFRMFDASAWVRKGKNGEPG